MMKKIRKMLKRQEVSPRRVDSNSRHPRHSCGDGVQHCGSIQRQAKIAAHNANVRIITNAANMYIMMNNGVPEEALILLSGTSYRIPTPHKG